MPTIALLNPVEPDESLARACEVLVEQGVIEPLSDNNEDVRQWLDWELASLVEGHFHRVVEMGAVSAPERDDWECRVAEGTRGLREPRRDEFRRVFWLRRGGTRVGTLGVGTIRHGRTTVGISSLYVAPDFRGEGIASRTLAAVHDVMERAAGAEAVCLSTHWCWQRATRFYLDRGWWVANWKHSLLLVQSSGMPPYRVEFMGTRSTFSVRNDTAWTPLIQATHRGTVLGWTELDALEGLVDSVGAVYALSKKKATTIALDPAYDRLLTRAARERGVSRSEFIRQQLGLVLEQYRRHPAPASAGVLRRLREPGDEAELFGGRHR